MIATNSYLNFWADLAAQGGGTVTITAACGTSSTPTTAGMTALVSQVATAINVIPRNINNRLEITSQYGPGSAYTAVEFAVFFSSPGIATGMLRQVGGPIIKGIDASFNHILREDSREGV